MSCKLGSTNVTWKIDPQDLVEVYPLLLLDYESSGKIQFHNQDNTMKATAVTSKSINKGEKDSVMTPMGLTTYHTHPNSCYETEKVIWGWPSGEDIAQTMLWALDGNLIHIVFSVEGPYIIEVNPCFIVFMKSLDNEKRGALYHWIQEIGRATHELRTVAANRACAIKPEDWVDFVNSLFVCQKRKKPVISCSQPTVFSKNKLVRENLDVYLRKFGGTKVKFPGISGNGWLEDKVHETSVDKFVELFEEIRKMNHSFKCGTKHLSGSPQMPKKWKRGGIFHCTFVNHATSLAQQKASRKKADWVGNYHSWITKRILLDPCGCGTLPVAVFPEMKGRCTENSVKKFRKDTFEDKGE